MSNAKLAYAVWPWGLKEKSQMITALQDIKAVGYKYFESVATAVDLFRDSLPEFQAIIAEHQVFPVSFNFWNRGDKQNDVATVERSLDFLAANKITRMNVQAAGKKGGGATPEELRMALETVLFDKAYVDFIHLYELTEREVYWVTRAKDNLQYSVVINHATDNPRVLSDEIIRLKTGKSLKAYLRLLRRVKARVEINGEDVEIVFLTNHLEWSAWTVTELYRCRWDIEVFFKEIKQTLQLSDFLGHNANAVRWQIWMGLLVHLLLRYLAHLSAWGHSFTRLFTVARAVLWRYFNLMELLDSYGTARPPGRICGCPEQAYLPGFG